MTDILGWREKKGAKNRNNLATGSCGNFLK
jgi:hypothetical protein